MRLCRACLKRYEAGTIFHFFDTECPFCNTCLRQIDHRVHFRVADGIRCLCLGYYEGKMKDYLIRYKESLDYELKTIFLYPYATLLSLIFAGCLAVWAPSSPARIKERGFDHMEGIASNLNLERCAALTKPDGTEQKEMGRQGRLAISDRITLNPGVDIAGRRILLLDDVVSTGATLAGCHRALLSAGARSIFTICLMDNDEEHSKKHF